MKKNIIRIFSICLVIILTSCSSQKINPDKYLGEWFASIKLPGGELPFKFKILNENNKLNAIIINGNENVIIKVVKFENDSLTLFLPAFNTRLRLKSDKKLKRLKGNLNLIKRGGIQQIMPVFAKNSEFKIQSKPVINISGRWDVKFVDYEQNITISVGEFEQNGNKVTGTFLTTTGDYRYLNGFVKGNKLQLSTFDGAHVFLFKAKLDNDGKLRGNFWSGTTWHESWVGIRNENASLPDEDSLTFLKEGYNKIYFNLEDINGKKVSLNDEKFKGKVVLVNLAGSWCPNCHDEAKFLSEYYDKNKDKGLEIVALMFENYKDKNKNILQIKRFKNKFDIKYDLLYAGLNDKEGAAKLLPMLDKVLAFPTTIYLDRKGIVRKITTGFSGPGTGDHYIKFQEKFDRFVNHLLSEK